MSTRRFAFVLAPAAALVAGCASTKDLFPCDRGLEWTYSVRTGFGAEHVEDIRIGRRVTVAGAEGFTFEGPLGESRHAWKGGTLWCESLPNASFSPAAPLFDGGQTNRKWQGEIVTVFGKEPAKATLTHRDEKLTLGGRPFETVRTDLEIDRPIGRTTLTTWFAREVGIVRQEQRTRGALDLRMDWISGPKQGSIR